MIGKLKRKFIILATVSMFILMTVLVLIMNIVNFSSVVTEGDTVLDVLLQSEMSFGGDKTVPAMPNIQMRDIIPRGMSPEVPYESRYFTVTVTNDGEIKNSDLSRIISVDDNNVNSYITEAVESNKERGFIGQFRFMKSYDGNMTKIIFLDCGRKLDSFYTFLWTSISVGLFGCIAVFVAFLFVSGKIVKPIAESYEKQKRFISDAGHEIKTPLTIINANVDLLECDGEREELSDIRQQTNRLTELTNNLIFLSKIEETEQTVKKIEMPLSDIVGETANSFQSLATAKSVAFSAEIEPNITVNGSPDEIRSLVSILLDNAIKYSPEGGIVSLRLSGGKKNVALSVFNISAEKINPEDLPKVFDRFYRTDESRNSQTGGHGIGLSIAKAITEAHGGHIYARTKSGYDFEITAEIGR